jgi:hypothetical protein
MIQVRTKGFQNSEFLLGRPVFKPISGITGEIEDLFAGF